MKLKKKYQNGGSWPPGHQSDDFDPKWKAEQLGFAQLLSDKKKQDMREEYGIYAEDPAGMENVVGAGDVLAATAPYGRALGWAGKQLSRFLPSATSSAAKTGVSAAESRAASRAMERLKGQTLGRSDRVRLTSPHLANEIEAGLSAGGKESAEVALQNIHRLGDKSVPSSVKREILEGMYYDLKGRPPAEVEDLAMEVIKNLRTMETGQHPAGSLLQPLTESQLSARGGTSAKETLLRQGKKGGRQDVLDNMAYEKMRVDASLKGDIFREAQRLGLSHGRLLDYSTSFSPAENKIYSQAIKNVRRANQGILPSRIPNKNANGGRIKVLKNGKG